MAIVPPRLVHVSLGYDVLDERDGSMGVIQSPLFLAVVWFYFRMLADLQLLVKFEVTQVEIFHFNCNAQDHTHVSLSSKTWQQTVL